MKVLFLDNDGVICLQNNWGSRYNKRRKVKYVKSRLSLPNSQVPLYLRFDNFDNKSIKVLNEIIEKTNCEIVISSDWRLDATLDELGEYYINNGIIKKPIGVTKLIDYCDIDLNFNWNPSLYREQERIFEIKQYLKDHPEITHWVAVDDMDLSYDYYHKLNNFVHTPKPLEGIKQNGIKEKIMKFLI